MLQSLSLSLNVGITPPRPAWDNWASLTLWGSALVMFCGWTIVKDISQWQLKLVTRLHPALTAWAWHNLQNLASESRERRTVNTFFNVGLFERKFVEVEFPPPSSQQEPGSAGQTPWQRLSPALNTDSDINYSSADDEVNFYIKTKPSSI